MPNVLIVYGGYTGTTKRIAERLRLSFGDPMPRLLDVGEALPEDLLGQELLVLALPTWGVGDLTEGWEQYFGELKALRLDTRKVALVGLGDQQGHPDSFVDAMGLLYDIIVHLGAEVIGPWPTTGYRFLSSRAVRDGSFVGLAIDELNQPELTGERIDAWVKSLSPQL